MNDRREGGSLTYDYEAGFDDPGNKNAWFERHIGRNRRVLEIGCATGYVGEYLAQACGCSVTGVEISEAAARQAVGRGCYDEVLVGDIQDPSVVSQLRDREFDFVLFGDVLEHLLEPERVLRSMSALLAPAGRALICIPNIVHWSMRARILFGRFEYADQGILDRTHLRFYTPRTARELVIGAKLQVVEAGGVVWLPAVAHRLPRNVLRRLEAACGRLAPNLFYGQVLIAASLPTEPATTS